MNFRRCIKSFIFMTISFFVFFNLCQAEADWDIQTADSVNWVGEYTSIALDSDGNPHISYYDATNHDLRYAYYDGIWHGETEDSANWVGEYTSLALDSDDNPHISYYDATNHDLRYAYYDGIWHIETVDSVNLVGEYTSIALDSSDNPHISYYDATNQDLKYAFRAPITTTTTELTTTTAASTTSTAGTTTTAATTTADTTTTIVLTTSSTTTTICICLAEIIYGVYSEETELLRSFRDDTLKRTPEGREIIRLYYEWSPAMVKAVGEDEGFKAELKEMMDGILPIIREEGE